MRDDGVKLADGAEDDYARLVTDDPKVAEKYKKYGFEENDDYGVDDDDKVEFG